VKFLVVHPGASWATHDVHVGVVEGLRAADVPVVEFRLDNRIARSHDFLHYLWRRQRRIAPSEGWPKPTPVDVLYQSSTGLIERALEKKCTDVLIISAMFLIPDRIRLARQAGLRVWLLCTETPYAMADELRIAAMVDGVWTNERSMVEAFRSVNPCVAYLPHAWREGVHNHTVPTAADQSGDVLFCGTFFRERVQLLEAIDWEGLGIDLRLYGTIDLLPKRSKLQAYARGALVPNDQLVTLARQSKIALNLFRKPTDYKAESLNPRLYEMAAAGVCIVSDDRLEVSQKFGVNVPTFSTPEEAGALLRSLLDDPLRRSLCASNAQRCVKNDSWKSRAQQVLINLTEWKRDKE